MATDMCIRRLTRELKSLQKDPLQSPKIVALPNESNILEWHYVIEGNKGTPYEGGFYHGKLIFPKEYPLKPPGVMMLTPSGRFQPNRRLCLSMSDFHPESWNPMWSVGTILTGLYSFMLETGPTLGSIATSMAQKRRFALKSLEFNVQNSMFVDLFPDYVELEKERRKLMPVGQGPARSVDLLHSQSTNLEDMNGLYTAVAGVFAVISLFFAYRFL